MSMKTLQHLLTSCNSCNARINEFALSIPLNPLIRKYPMGTFQLSFRATTFGYQTYANEEHDNENNKKEEKITVHNGHRDDQKVTSITKMRKLMRKNFRKPINGTNLYLQEQVHI